MNNRFDHKPVHIKTHFVYSIFIVSVSTYEYAESPVSYYVEKETGWRNARLMLVMQIVGREPAWPRAHKVHRPREVSTKLICETEMTSLLPVASVGYLPELLVSKQKRFPYCTPDHCAVNQRIRRRLVGQALEQMLVNLENRC